MTWRSERLEPLLTIRRPRRTLHPVAASVPLSLRTMIYLLVSPKTLTLTRTTTLTTRDGAAHAFV